MPAFAFRARDRSGRDLAGTEVASSLAASAESLRSRGLFVLELRPQGESAGQHATAWRRPLAPLLRGPRGLDVEQALRQLALMERAGLPLLQSLRTAARNAARRSMGRVLDRLAERVEAGGTLAEALREHPRLFPPVVVEVLHAGEQSGGLEAALERATEHLQRTRELRSLLLQALFYPAIVITLAAAVAGYMVFAVVPVLEGFLRASSRKLPWITRALVDTSVFARTHVLELLALLALGGGLALALDRYPPARRWIDRASYRLPLLGPLRRLSSTARFSRSLQVLIGNGINLVRALELCRAIAGRPEAADAIERARGRVLAGEPLAESLAGPRAFSPLLARLVDVGERSGTLEQVLSEVAAHQEGELRAWIKRASTLIEPVLTLVVGAIVGFVYIAFFLAMFAAAGAA